MKVIPIQDQITLATVRLSVALPNGKVRLGTGFCFRAAAIDDWPLGLIITNKHVVAGDASVAFQMAVAGYDGMPLAGYDDCFTMSRDVFEQFRIDHPDPSVDLCAIITWPIITELKKRNERLANRHMNRQMIATVEELDLLSAIEDVIVVGYPTGLCDELNNRPIVRRGITATHVRINFNGRAEFLIDAPSFPGSSGSPVFLYKPELHISDNEDFLVTAVPRLIGVLAEAPTHTEFAEIENVYALNDLGPTARYYVPLGLGTVLQARRISELLLPAEARAIEVKAKAIVSQSDAPSLLD